MNKVKVLSILFKVFSLLLLLSAMLYSAYVFSVGRQYGHSDQIIDTALVVALTYLTLWSAVAVYIYYVGILIDQRRSYVLCKRVSMFLCILFPLGTVLGLYSMKILSEWKSAFKKDIVCDREIAMNEESIRAAPLEKRVPAFVIDFIIAGVIYTALVYPFVMLPLIRNQIMPGQVMERIVLVTTIASLYMFFRDTVRGRSVGKYLMKIRVRTVRGARVNASFGQLVLRNIFVILWPLEALLLLTGKKRVGDRLARTRVVIAGRRGMDGHELLPAEL